MSPLKQGFSTWGFKFFNGLHIVFLALCRLEKHNQYNRNTFLYQNCLINRFQGSNKRKKAPLELYHDFG